MDQGATDHPSENYPSRVVLPPGGAPVNHGKTSAAWATVWIVMIGGAVCAVGAILESTVLIIAGGAAIVLGLVVGKVMQAMGLGQQGPESPPAGQRTSSSRR